MNDVALAALLHRQTTQPEDGEHRLILGKPGGPGLDRSPGQHATSSHAASRRLHRSHAGQQDHASLMHPFADFKEGIYDNPLVASSLSRRDSSALCVGRLRVHHPAILRGEGNQLRCFRLLTRLSGQFLNGAK